jgi:hypothetical protein
MCFHIFELNIMFRSIQLELSLYFKRIIIEFKVENFKLEIFIPIRAFMKIFSFKLVG